MILLIAFVTLFTGLFLEKKFSCMSRFLSTRLGKILLGNTFMMLLSLAATTYLIVFLMSILNLETAFVFILLSIMLGFLMLTIIVRDGLMKN